MLIVLFMVAVITATVIIGIIFSRLCYDDAAIGSFCLSTIMTVFLIVLFVILITNIATVEADTLKLQNRYDTLYYQVSNGMYNNDNEVGKKELIDQIMEWNEYIITRRLYSKSIWVNWFYPVDYEQFKLIPIELVH